MRIWLVYALCFATIAVFYHPDLLIMKKVSLPTYIISLIAVAFLCFVVYMNLDNISDMR